MLTGTILALACGFGAADLEGTTVFVSPGHGFYHHPTLGWISQRGNTGSLVEDLENADTVFAFLVEYLRLAGADVWPCRTECPSPVEVIVDDEDPDYEEDGTWQTTTSGGYDGTARYANAAPGSPAIARFRPLVPQSGRYPLYLWFVEGTNRAADALVRVGHAAGTESLRVSQQRDGRTWRYIGTYYFFAGRGQTIEISADSSDTTKVVIADAIRLGGGIGTMEPNEGGTPSGRPRYEECSVYWARYQGAPPAVYNATADNDGNDDVTCRPRYAEFERDPIESALYLSYHTNAGGGTGTETYSYSGGATPGSDRLRDLLQEEVVRDLRRAWDPQWADRGVKQANFGELRLLNSMPGALIETAFHDNPQDLAAERSPRWRKIVSRAIYQAVARYVNGDGAILLPESPGGLVARATTPGGVRLSWDAPPSGDTACGAGAATRYRIYTSADGLAFAPLRETTAPSATISGLPAGKPVFFKVAALNAGGESFPSATAAVMLPGAEPAPRFLLVHGFSQDEGTLRSVVRESEALGDVLRLEPGRTPGGRDAACEHLWALATAESTAACDFADKDALGDFALDDYHAIVVASGDEETNVLPERAAQVLLAYVNAGGALIVSGSHLAKAIDASGGPQARALLAALSVDLDGEAQSPARLVPRDAFAALGPFLLGATTDWGRSGAAAFDRLRPLAGGRAAIELDTSAVAVLVPARSVFFGFPLEAVPEASFRAALLETSIAAILGPAEPPAPPIAVREGSTTIELTSGQAIAVVEAQGSVEARYLWRLEQGPPGGAVLPGEPWDFARAGLGYGDDDDVTALPAEARACATLLLRHAFTLDDPASLRSLVLDIRYDDGFVAFVGGVEVARRNVPAGGDRTSWAETSIDPTREEIEILAEALPHLRAGENSLAISIHNSSATSSDLTADLALRGGAPGRGQTFLIAPGALWHVFPCGQQAGASWSDASFDPSARVTPLRFTKAGTYDVSVRAETPHGVSAPASIVFTVLPEGGAVRFLRGDGNSDGAVDVADAVTILSFLFASGAGPCRSALDTNGSRSIDIADAVYLLQYIFASGTAPPAPGPSACGPPPAGDALGCAEPAGRCS